MITPESTKMYYKVSKQSETGKKFQALADRMSKAQSECAGLAQKYGFDLWYGEWGFVAGGISCCVFVKQPDMKTWKKSGEGFMPRKSSKLGKEIQSEIDGLSKIRNYELNACIGFDGAIFRTIGYSRGNHEFFGFVVMMEWEVEIPDDCVEITVTEYNALSEEIPAEA